MEITTEFVEQLFTQRIKKDAPQRPTEMHRHTYLAVEWCHLHSLADRQWFALRQSVPLAVPGQQSAAGSEGQKS